MSHLIHYSLLIFFLSLSFRYVVSITFGCAQWEIDGARTSYWLFGSVCNKRWNTNITRRRRPGMSNICANGTCVCRCIIHHSNTNNDRFPAHPASAFSIAIRRIFCIKVLPTHLSIHYNSKCILTLSVSSHTYTHKIEDTTTQTHAYK